jgi:glycerol-3-phosphate acyltransferase PlsY
VFREIGMKLAVPVAIFDLGKGALAVIIACKLLNIPIKEINLFVLLAALAVICGHMWSIYLKFRGGNGLSATFGAFAVIMPWELLVAIGLLLILVMITRNLVLSTNLGLLSVPISAWFIDSSLLLVVFSILVGVLLVIHFIPTAKRAIIQAGSEQKLIARLIRKQ